MNDSFYTEKILDKIQKPENDLIFASLIYDWYIHFWNNDWKFENIIVVGIANFTNSNTKIFNEKINIWENSNNNHQPIILKNIKTNQILYLILPNSFDTTDEIDVFYYDFPIYYQDQFQPQNENYVSISNIYDEQFIIEPNYFENQYRFTDFFNDKQKKLIENCGKMVQNNQPGLLMNLME